MQYQLLLKLEITETWISFKKQKKILILYGELTHRKIKSIRMIKNVIQIMGKDIPLVCMQIGLNKLEESHCENSALESKIQWCAEVSEYAIINFLGFGYMKGCNINEIFIKRDKLVGALKRTK